MTKGFRLLRFEYVFSVIIPCLLAIYLNDLDVTNQIWILAGFFFYAITGNTLNDFIDMKNTEEKETIERVQGYRRKEIAVLSLASFFLGTGCFLNVIALKPLLSFYLITIICLVIIYCVFKSLVIINHIILGISHIFLPYFMIKINAGYVILGFLPFLSVNEWLILSSVACVAYVGQMVHEMIDGDSLSRLRPKSARFVIWISSIISIIVSLTALIVTKIILFFPLLIFPIGIIYIFRKPRNDLFGRYSLKDIGIILGNLVLFYLIVLIIAP
jgi:hypothetical protein